MLVHFPLLGHHGEERLRIRLLSREFEKLVILDPLNGFKQQFDNVSEVINAAATADSKAMDTDSRNNVNLGSVPCEFHY